MTQEPAQPFRRVPASEDAASPRSSTSCGGGGPDDLTRLQTVLAPLGFHGLVAFCEQCQADHLYDWATLQSSSAEHHYGVTADTATMYPPDPLTYITVDYARGFYDAHSTQQRGDSEL